MILLSGAHCTTTSYRHEHHVCAITSELRNVINMQLSCLSFYSERQNVINALKFVFFTVNVLLSLYNALNSCVIVQFNVITSFTS